MNDDPEDYDDLAARHVSIARVLSLFTPYRNRLAGGAMLMVLASAIGIAGPFLLRAIIDTALLQQNLSLLVWLAFGMIAEALVYLTLPLPIPNTLAHNCCWEGHPIRHQSSTR